MHQYQQMELAKQRVEALQRQAEARRQRQAAKRVRRRSWFRGRRARRAAESHPGGTMSEIPLPTALSDGPMRHDGPDCRAA